MKVQRIINPYKNLGNATQTLQTAQEYLLLAISYSIRHSLWQDVGANLNKNKKKHLILYKYFF